MSTRSQKKFEEGNQDLEMKEMLQISKNGPNFKFKLYDSITEDRNEIEDYPAVIDLGLWSLHVVHEAF